MGKFFKWREFCMKFMREWLGKREKKKKKMESGKKSKGKGDM